MKNGSLLDLTNLIIKGQAPSNFDNTKRQMILSGIARGMMILHERGVIHRDLKCANVLLDSDLKPYVTDFGLSKFSESGDSKDELQSQNNLGTPFYMAPEVMQSNNFNTKADVYSFGILMYEIITGNRAYSDLLHDPNKMNPIQFSMKIIEGLRPEFKPNFLAASPTTGAYFSTAAKPFCT